ncbi:MAG: response regulator transcription factor [Acidimicrobiales bacterium]
MADPIRLLLADDHRLLREGLGRSLSDEGFDVVGEANDGAEAVQLVDEHHPDVVLMDVTMPNMDGIEATRRIVAAHPETRIVMLTMHATADVVRRAIDAGATGYLVKDCSTDDIVATVRAAAEPDATLSPALARRLLAEAHRLEPAPTGAERIISKREVEVLQGIADGLSPSEVAERLFISQKTVKNHLASIYQKLDARDRTQAVVQAVRMGIIHLR